MPATTHRSRHGARSALTLAFALPVVSSLVAGIAGGLLRAGVGLPERVSGDWLGSAVTAHAFLMICAFMGTVIGIERAVAVRHPVSFAAPLASASAGVAMLSGWTSMAQWLAVAASAAFIAVNVVVVRRQRAAHTVLLLVAAVAWFSGCVLFALNPPLVSAASATVPLWFSFLVLTIAAERLEMTRLMRRRAGASWALYAVFAGLLTGAALSAIDASSGGIVYGVSLAGLAAWLVSFDIARRTVHASGLSRYMAICLLLGYGWLFIAGIAWVLTSLGFPCRDAALHGLALGFVVSMMLGHAPVILPAIARVKLLFGRAFYLPLALLHLSLAVRLAGGFLDAGARASGAVGNAVAILVFALTVAGAAMAWRRKYAPHHPLRHHEIAADH